MKSRGREYAEPLVGVSWCLGGLGFFGARLGASDLDYVCLGDEGGLFRECSIIREGAGWGSGGERVGKGRELEDLKLSECSDAGVDSFARSRY